MEYSDFDLIRGIKSGDRSALDILIRRWYSRIYGYTFKMIGHDKTLMISPRMCLLL